MGRAPREAEGAEPARSRYLSLKAPCERAGPAAIEGRVAEDTGRNSMAGSGHAHGHEAAGCVRVSVAPRSGPIFFEERLAPSPAHGCGSPKRADKPFPVLIVLPSVQLLAADGR